MTMNAKQFYEQAEKKASGSGGFLNKVFGSGSYALEEAADLYIQAANAYRIAKDSQAAGEAFEKAATTQLKTDSRDDAANTLVDAYKAYRQTSPADAVRVLKQAVEMFMLRGQFRRAANYEMDIGSVHEQQESPGEAAEAYERAANLYYDDQAEALSNKAFLKVAELNGLAGNYKVAIENFERVAKQSLNSNLSKWSLKEYFVKATLCHLCLGDEIGTQNALAQYVEWDSSFASTREYKLLEGLIEAAKAGDEQLFSDKLYEYDQFAKLDQWKVKICLQVKDKLQQSEDDDLL